MEADAKMGLGEQDTLGTDTCAGKGEEAALTRGKSQPVMWAQKRPWPTQWAILEQTVPVEHPTWSSHMSA